MDRLFPRDEHELGSRFSIRGRNCFHGVGVGYGFVSQAVDDHHIARIAGDLFHHVDVIGVSGINCPELSHGSFHRVPGYLAEIRDIFMQIIHQAECRIHQHHSLHFFRALCSSECTDETSLALSEEEQVPLINIGLALHKIHNGVQIAYLRQDGHIHKVPVALAVSSASAEIKRINHKSICNCGLGPLCPLHHLCS